MAKWKSKESDRWAKPDDGPAADGVGYASPPLKARFRPGQSGNPRGRPKDAKGRKQIVAKIAGEMHWIVEDGTRRRRSTLELILLQLRNLAAQGDIQAFRAHHDLLAKYAPQETKSRGGYLVVPEQMTTSEEWVRVVAPRLEAYQRRLREQIKW
jgi:Family of unknown function (DUF5681)